MAQSYVTNLVTDLQLKQNVITNDSLVIANTSGLQAALDAKPNALDVSTALNGKQPLIVDDSLSISHTANLQTTLNSLALKQDALSDVPGNGVSLLLGAQLRKIYGHGGTVVAQSPFNLADANDPFAYQIRVSSEELQTALAAAQQKVQALSTDAFISNLNLTTYIAGNLETQSVRIEHVLLCALMLAPAENVDLAIRSWGNLGGAVCPQQRRPGVCRRWP